MSTLDGPRLEPVIEAVAQGTRGRLALVGGCAMRFYGSPRVTYDVDVIAQSAMLPPHRSLGALSFGGYRYRVKGVEVDVIVRDDDYRSLYLAALRDKTSTRFLHVGQVTVRVVAPEFLVLMKLDSGRGKDDDDVEFLLRKGRTDRARLLTLARKHLGFHAVKVLESMIEASDLMKGRDRLRLRRSARRR